jgi:hypothetical protein
VPSSGRSRCGCLPRDSATVCRYMNCSARSGSASSGPRIGRYVPVSERRFCLSREAEAGASVALPSDKLSRIDSHHLGERHPIVAGSSVDLLSHDQTVLQLHAVSTHLLH